jgi:NADPH:quinone reductase
MRSCAISARNGVRLAATVRGSRPEHEVGWRGVESERMAQMKAAVIYENGGPEVLRYEDVSDPECPDGCVVVDAEAISVEGGDLLARAAGELLATPHIVGYLSAGTISEVAAGVEGRAVGDRVVALNAAGSHAAKRVVPAAMTWPIPAGLDAARAACVPVAFGTAYECLFTAGKLAAGQTVLIHAGAGGVGMAAIQLAKRAGATVIATASSDEKLKRLEALGLDHPINYATESFVEHTNQLTSSRGVEVVLDSIGGQNLIDSVGVLAYQGTLVNVGVAARAGSTIEARSLWTRNNSLRGVFLGGAILSEYARVHPMIGEMLERVANGELRVEIDRSFPLAEAAAAHEYAESRKAFGRIVLTL